MGLIQRTTSTAMIEANHRNAAQSTGPRTPRGKAISRHNAAKHWGRAEAYRDFLPALGEREKDFKAVREGLYRSLEPQDEFETMLVDEMAENRWRLQRLIRGEAAAMAVQRRERKAVLDARRAEHETGGTLSEAERQLIGFKGMVGLHDSPTKFYRILTILQALRMFVCDDGFRGEGKAYLQILYGPHPGLQGQKLIGDYGRAEAEWAGADAAGQQRRREEFLLALDAEIARFEAQAGRDREVRRELAAPRVELELLNSQLDPYRVVFCQETLERRFDRKWKLLMRYRRARQKERLVEARIIKSELAAGPVAPPAAELGDGNA